MLGDVLSPAFFKQNNMVYCGRICAFLVLFISVQLKAGAEVRLPELVSDAMVLQRDLSTRIWGWAEPAEKIRVSFTGNRYETTADNTGHWEIMLKPGKAGGPHEMQISATNKITLRNIVIGDVWLCSGQSNMVLPMERVKEKYPEVIARSSNPMIRQFMVPVCYDFQHELNNIPSGKWAEANPENVLNFTAAGYFFARDIYETYQIPVGLINVSAGGSPVEAWLDKETLKRLPEAYAEAGKFKNNEYVGELRKKEALLSRDWYTRLWNEDEGSKNGRSWLKPGYDASFWPVMKLPAFWAELRDEQQRTTVIKNTAMVSAIDLGEWNDIHPLDKENVGKRLALAARYIAYGENKTEYSGPVFESAVLKSGKVVITFSHTGKGLLSKGGGALKHFSIKGADGKWVWAKAKIKGKKVEVWREEVENPLEVRYAWADNPEGVNLYNQAGLPANPFIATLPGDN